MHQPFFSAHRARNTAPLVAALIAAVGLLPATAAAHLDVVFLLDTTGSMGAELGEAKARVKEIAAALSAARPQETIRTGVVAYRDQGDAYVTRVSALNDDVEVTRAFLGELGAGGGGDGPEDVLSGLKAALALDWDLRPETERQIFLIADAPAHEDYENHPTFDALIEDAVQKKIVVHAVGCRSLNTHGRHQFRVLARKTEGRFQHIGRVAVGQEVSLTEAIVAAAKGASAARAFEDAKVTTTRLHVNPRKAKSEAPPTIEVRLLSRSGGGLKDKDAEACHAVAAVPLGLSLSAPPKVASDNPDRLDVRLQVKALRGQGAISEMRFTLPHCVAPSAAVHVEMEG